MKKKFALAFICLGVVVGFQNCNHNGLTSAYGTSSGLTDEASLSIENESEDQGRIALSDQDIIAGLDAGQPGESCDTWLQRNGVAAATKSAFHTYDGIESKWGQGGVNENSACAMMIYSSLNKSWSCTAGASSHIDQFDPNPALASYPAVSCNDGVRSVRTVFSGLTILVEE